MNQNCPTRIVTLAGELSAALDSATTSTTALEDAVDDLRAALRRFDERNAVAGLDEEPLS